MDIRKIFNNSLISGLIAAVVMLIIVVIMFCLSFVAFLYDIPHSPYYYLVEFLVYLVLVVALFIPGLIGAGFEHFKLKEINFKTGVLSGLFTSLISCTFVILIIGLITILLCLIGAHATIQGFIIKGVIFIVVTSACGSIAGTLYGFVVSKINAKQSKR